MMSTEKRTPAFWRVVRYVDGREQVFGRAGWSHFDHWDLHRHYLLEREAMTVAEREGGKVRPVFRNVVKKPKSHGIGWAVKQLRAGKRVRQKSWQKQSFIVLTDDGRVRWGKDGIPFYPSCELLSHDWETAE